MIDFKIKNSINPASLENIHIGGSVGQQMDLFFEKRVTSDFAKNEIVEEALRAFVEKKDDETAVGYWRGEFWGKLAISAARVYRYTKDENLKSFLIQSTKRLLSLQDDDGYLGSYKNKDSILAADPKVTYGIIGWPCNWNWNVWCRKYTLWGLIEIYGICPDNEILNGAVKLANHLISQLKAQKLHLCDVGTFNGLPAGSILKPMLCLYRITENKKYLDFCLEEVKAWEREDGKVPNLITNSATGIPVHEWYPNPNSWAKAYEMMSCLDGLCELYRVTGDKKYLNTVSDIHTLLRKYEYNVLFSVGLNDQFSGGAYWENSCTEPCDVIHWMRICSELYKLTGDVKYMDDIERAFYNPFLAGSVSDGTWSARAVRAAGRHEYATQMDMKYSHCCTNNMPRGYLNVAESFCMYSDDALYVNLYTEYTGTLNTPFGKVDVEISGTYLTDGKVNVKLTSEKPIIVKFRIPSWSKHNSICCGERVLNPGYGCYCTLNLNQGSNDIAIKFECVPEIHDFEGVIEDFAFNDFRHRRYVEGSYPVTKDHMVWNRRSTLTYGALLLARSQKCGNTPKEMFGSDKTVCGKKYTCTLTPVAADNTRVKFKAVFKNDTDCFATTVCDFATGSNEMPKDDMELFSVWF